MKSLQIILFSMFFLSLHGYAQPHVHIHFTPEEKKGEEEGGEEKGKEEKKEEGKEEKKEEEKLELPEPITLKINANNDTEYNLGFHIHAAVEGENNEQINVENISSKNTPQPITYAVLNIPPKDDEKILFSFVEGWGYSQEGKKIDCKIIKPKEPEEKEKEEGGEEEGGGKKEEKVEELEKGPQAEDGNEEEQPQYFAKKSITIHFYVPKGQDYPQCAISFDTEPPKPKKEEKPKEEKKSEEESEK